MCVWGQWINRPAYLEGESMFASDKAVNVGWCQIVEDFECQLKE